MPSAAYTASFSSSVKFSNNPSASLNGPDTIIPDLAIVKRLVFEVYSGVSNYNASLWTSFTVTDSSGRSVTIESVVNTGSDNRIWAELEGKPDEELDWNNLSRISLGGTGDLTVRAGYTATLTVKYEDLTAPYPPSSVKVSPSSLAGGKATLSWSGASDGTSNPIAGYDVQRSANPNSGFSSIGTAAGNTMAVQSAEGNGNSYYYRIRALGSVSGLDSELSSAYAQLKTEWSAPSAPGTPELSSIIAPPNKTVFLSWPAGADGLNNPVYRYAIYKSVNGGEWSLIGYTGDTIFGVSSPAENGTAFRYAVRSIGTVGGSDSPLSAESAALYCTFNAPDPPPWLTINGETSIFLDAKASGTLEWGAGTSGSNNPVIGYQVFADGKLLGTTEETRYTIRANYQYGATITYTVRTQGQYSVSAESSPVFVTTNTPAVPPRSTEAIRQFLIFDQNDVLQFVRTDALEMTITEHEYRLDGAFAFNAEKELKRGMRIGWLEAEEMQLFEIRQVYTDAVAFTQKITAEHVAMAELLDEALENVIISSLVSPRNAVSAVLANTEWEVGNVTADIPFKSTRFTYQSVWSALLAIRDTWGIFIKPRLAYTYNGIERYIDVLDRLGENRGVRLTLNLNVQEAGITYDDRELYTALYGLGNKQNDYPITFESVFWSTDNGDPANKPTGQKWIENPAATALYGRRGRKRTGFVSFQTDDPEELTSLTWAALETVCAPKVTVQMTAFDLSSYGYSFQGIFLGDDVVAVLDPIGIEVRLRITTNVRDVLRPENGRPTIGSYRPTVIYQIANIK